jgi:polyhydroxyalkanoate synthesis regulator phasin
MKAKQVHQSIEAAVKKAWSDASSAIGSVEEEVNRRFRQLVDKTGLSQGSEELQRVVTDVGRRLQTSGEELERRLEESVKSAVARVRAPVTEELANLRSRAEKLGQRVESLRGGKKKTFDSEGDPVDPRQSAERRDQPPAPRA